MTMKMLGVSANKHTESRDVSVSKIISYQMDQWLSTDPASKQITILFGVTLSLIIGGCLALFAAGENSFYASFWSAIAGAGLDWQSSEADTLFVRCVSLMLSIAGILVTAVLLGLVSARIDSRVRLPAWTGGLAWQSREADTLFVRCVARMLSIAGMLVTAVLLGLVSGGCAWSACLAHAVNCWHGLSAWTGSQVRLPAWTGQLDASLGANLDCRRGLAVEREKSDVLECDHVVIIGWSIKIYTVIAELCLGAEASGGTTIVVFSELGKEEMEERIASRGFNIRNSTIVCRTGDPLIACDLAKVSIHYAKSIIVLSTDPRPGESDARVLRVVINLFTVHQYICKQGGKGLQGHIIAELNKIDQGGLVHQVSQFYPGVEAKISVIVVGEILSRMMVQNARCPYIGQIFESLVGFEGSEWYALTGDAAAKCAGYCFANLQRCFTEAVPIGINSASEGLMINPPRDYIICEGDTIYLLAEDDTGVEPQTELFESQCGHKPLAKSMPCWLQSVDSEASLIESSKMAKHPFGGRILVIGWRKDITRFIRVIDSFTTIECELWLYSDVPLEDRWALLDEGGLSLDADGRHPDLRVTVKFTDDLLFGNNLIRLKLERLEPLQFRAILILAEEMDIQSAVALTNQASAIDSSTLATVFMLRSLQIQEYIAQEEIQEYIAQEEIQEYIAQEEIQEYIAQEEIQEYIAQEEIQEYIAQEEEAAEAAASAASVMMHQSMCLAYPRAPPSPELLHPEAAEEAASAASVMMHQSMCLAYPRAPPSPELLHPEAAEEAASAASVMMHQSMCLAYPRAPPSPELLHPEAAEEAASAASVMMHQSMCLAYPRAPPSPELLHPEASEAAAAASDDDAPVHVSSLPPDSPPEAVSDSDDDAPVHASPSVSVYSPSNSDLRFARSSDPHQQNNRLIGSNGSNLNPSSSGERNVQQLEFSMSGRARGGGLLPMQEEAAEYGMLPQIRSQGLGTSLGRGEVQSHPSFNELFSGEQKGAPVHLTSANARRTESDHEVELCTHASTPRQYQDLRSDPPIISEVRDFPGGDNPVRAAAEADEAAAKSKKTLHRSVSSAPTATWGAEVAVSRLTRGYSMGANAARKSFQLVPKAGDHCREASKSMQKPFSEGQPMGDAMKKAFVGVRDKSVIVTQLLDPKTKRVMEGSPASSINSWTHASCVTIQRLPRQLPIIRELFGATGSDLSVRATFTIMPVNEPAISFYTLADRLSIIGEVLLGYIIEGSEELCLNPSDKQVAKLKGSDPRNPKTELPVKEGEIRLYGLVVIA
eukprot:gene10275-8198_t